MSLSNSVRKRYTPPTCTLEIVAKASPLSRWIGQSVLKELRFELRFDDPRQATDKRITVWGDRTTLERLHDAVAGYIQEFLSASPTELPLTRSLALPEAEGTALEDYENGSISSSSSLVNPPQVLVEDTPDPLSLSLESNPKVRSLQSHLLEKEIYLQPKSLLTHALFLGQLANPESGSVLELSALQLFDLATALDEYATSVVTLPNLNPRRRAIASAPWVWAAAVMVFAVGVTTASVQWLKQSESTQQATAPTAKEESKERNSQLAQVPPTSTEAIPNPPSPLPTPTVPPSLSPPPKVQPPQAVPVPGQAKGSASQGSQQPNFSVNPNPKRGSRSESGSGKGTSQGSSTRTGNPRSTSERSPRDQGPTPIPSGDVSLPKLPSLERPSSDSVIPEIASRPSITQGGTRKMPGTRSVEPNTPLPSSNSADTNPDPNSRLFDTTPQIAQARAKLQAGWTPPSDLTDKIEYYIWVNPDGSIDRILPLGRVAELYIDQTNIPLPGQSFVSPMNGGSPLKMRVVFFQDGKVETFGEN